MLGTLGPPGWRTHWAAVGMGSGLGWGQPGCPGGSGGDERSTEVLGAPAALSMVPPFPVTLAGAWQLAGVRREEVQATEGLSHPCVQMRVTEREHSCHEAGAVTSSHVMCK